MPKIQLTLLEPTDRESFIKENQYAFKFGALEKFGERDNHFEEDREIISRETINKCIDKDQPIDDNHGPDEMFRFIKVMKVEK